MLRRAAAAGLLVGWLSTGALAQPYFTNGIPLAAPPLTGVERFPADSYLTPPAAPQQEGIEVSQLQSYVISTPGTWTAKQTFTNSDLALLGSSTGETTFFSGNSSATNYTVTLPANSGALAELNLAQTWAAAQTFGATDLLVAGSSTGVTEITTGNSGAGDFVATLPANSGTVAELNLGQLWGALQTFGAVDLAIAGSSTGVTTLTTANASATNFTATLPANSGVLEELNLAQTWSAAKTNTAGLLNGAGGSGALPIYDGVGGLKTGVALHLVVLNQALTLGAATITLTGSSVFGNTPVCVGSDQTALLPVQVVATSTSAITLAGTGSDVIGVICAGN